MLLSSKTEEPERVDLKASARNQEHPWRKSPISRSSQVLPEAIGSIDSQGKIKDEVLGWEQVGVSELPSTVLQSTRHGQNKLSSWQVLHV